MGLKRLIETWRGEVRPDEGEGNPQTGEVWSRYKDGTTRQSNVWQEVPGTVARYKTFDECAAAYRLAESDKVRDELQAIIDQSIMQEDIINLQYANGIARQMYLAGVNSPERLKRLQEAAI